MPTSSLSAALHHPEQALQSRAKAAAGGPDLSIFPCLQSIDGAVAIQITAGEVEDLVLYGLTQSHQHHSQAIPFKPSNASLPTKTPGQADYQLNPHRRRGGAELSGSLGGATGGFQNGSAGSYKSNFMSDKIIAALPPSYKSGAGAAEELPRVRPLAPTPARSQLNGVPMAKLSLPGAEGQLARRAALRGARVVFVTAGYSGKRFVFEKAHQLGVKCVVLDGPDSWAREMEEEGTIEKLVVVDMEEAATVFQRCCSALSQVETELGPIHGVISFCELAQPLAARLAEHMNLPGNSPAAVDAARSKFATREAMQNAGLATIRYYKVTSEADLQAAADHVGFPAVIKPTCGAASIGVIRVENWEELKLAFEKVKADLKHVKVVAGAIEEGDEEEDGDAEGNAEEWMALEMMVEEYLDGDEVDVDIVLNDSRPLFGNVTDNWPTLEPYFNETGSNCPSVLPLSAQKELIDLSVAAVRCLGFVCGVFHVECKYGRRGARLVEVNCRMGGGCVRDINLLVWGVDMVEEALMAVVGLPLAPHAASHPLMCIAEYCINAKVTGILRDEDYLAPFRARPEVLYAIELVEAGHKCVCVEDGLPTWVCELMVKAGTVEEAIAHMKTIEAELVLPITPQAMHHAHAFPVHH